MTKFAFYGTLAVAALTLAGLSPAPAEAQLIITPTFDSSITSDANAVAIEGVINNAINTFETTYSNPINVPIYFAEGGGLGESGKELYLVQYSAFRAGLAANQVISGMADQATALASLPNTTNNPVTGTSGVALSTADIKALGGPSLAGVNIGGNNYDGEILLNTAITTPGSPGSTLQYVLTPVVEHEIDEVLGLGSSLAQSFQSTPSAEDLYRYSGPGAISYTTNTSALAYFSIDGGNTLLAQFDNQGDGGDWADWQSNPIPNGVPAQVQDAFAYPGSDPAYGPNEITALNVIGYNGFASQGPPPNGTPEPGSMALLAGMMVPCALVVRRKFSK